MAENSARLGGGGILVGAGVEARLNAVTIAANAARAAPGAGSRSPTGRSAAIDNSLVARNLSALGGPDCDGAGFESGGGNLVGSGAGCATLGGPGDLVRPLPLIGGLGSNGGPTPTVALRRGSPAIGAAGADAPSRDQRNLARRDPDAGAFERR